jgi:PKD repeat protein
VYFTDLSTGTPTQWFWEFGDGSTSNLQNPVYQYQGYGYYTVNLTVSNDIGSNKLTKTSYINVHN